jgi:hypothetical protein
VEIANNYEGVPPAVIDPEDNPTQKQRAEIAVMNSAIIPRQEQDIKPAMVEPDDYPEDPDSDDDDGDIEVIEGP